MIVRSEQMSNHESMAEPVGSPAKLLPGQLTEDGTRGAIDSGNSWRRGPQQFAAASGVLRQTGDEFQLTTRIRLPVRARRSDYPATVTMIIRL